MGIILDVNAVCTKKMVNNVISMNGQKEICGSKKSLEAVVGLTSRVN